MPKHRPTRRWQRAGLLALTAALLSACQISPPRPQDSRDSGGAPTASQPSSSSAPSPASGASHAQSYRQDAAQHLYQRNAQRIYPGKLPALLYAVGVLELQITRSGDIASLQWRRAPRHAPEVMKEIERTVRAAAPFPALARMQRVTYTETWLWDRSGRFQLHSLSEGQLGE